MSTTRRREQEVWEACDQLLAALPESEQSISLVTGEKIRDKLVELGCKRGNHNQIYQYRKSWMESRGLVTDTAKTTDNVLSDRIMLAVKSVYHEINNEANEVVRETKERCADEVEALGQSKRKLRDDYDLLKGQFVRLEAKYDALFVENQEQGERFKQLESENSITVVKLEDIKREYQFYKSESINRIEEQGLLHQENKTQLQNELKRMTEQYESQILQQQIEIGKMKLKLNDKNDALSKEILKCKELQKDIQYITDQNIQNENELSELRTNNNQLQQKLEQVKSDLHLKINTLENEVRIRDSSLSEKEKFVGSLNDNKRVLQDQIDTQNRYIDKLEKQIINMEVKIKKLSAKKPRKIKVTSV